MKEEEGVEQLLFNTFNKFKSQITGSSDILVLQRTIITVLLSLLPTSHEDLIKQIEKLIITSRNGELDFKIFLFHIWITLITSENHPSKSEDIQSIVTQIIKEVFTESQNENKRQTKIHNQRKSQAENQSQRRDKLSPLQNEVIVLLSQFLISPNNAGGTVLLDDLAKSISSSGGPFPPLVAGHITVNILQSVTNSEVEAFKEKIAAYLCGYLHATRSGLKTFIIDTVLPAFYNSSNSSNSLHLEVLWGSIVLLPDETEVLRYFFKFGSLFISAAKKSTTDFQIFLDKRLWDAIKKGLTAVDSMPRKQALYLLKNIINLPNESWSKFLPWHTAQWQTYFSLYEVMDESKSHLLKPIWSQIETLFSAPREVTAPFELEPTKESYWLSVLFSRGISHGNPNVRDLILPSLLSCSPHVLQLESSFIFGDLLQTFNDLSLELLDSTTDKYSESLGRFWLNYLVSFADYDVTSQGFTTSLIEYLRDSATITTPAIIFFLESLIQLGSLHENECKKRNKFTLLLSHNSLEYLRSILECRPISESTIQNTKLYDKVLTTVIKLTDLGASSHPPSAFDFPTLSRFLSTFPQSFLRSNKRLPRILSWASRFEHLDQPHMQHVMKELKEHSNQSESRFALDLALFSRAFTVRPYVDLFADLIEELKLELDTKVSKLDVSMEIVQSILLELHSIGLEGEVKSAYSKIVVPVLPGLIRYITDQSNEFLQHFPEHTSEILEIQATKLQIYATFINVIWKTFTPQLSSDLVAMFAQFSLYFCEQTSTSFPITIITAAFNFWKTLGINIPTQLWRDWNEKAKIPTLISKVLKVNARASSGQSASKSNELVSTFFSNKWSLLDLLVEKSYYNNISLSSGVIKELFESGIEVMDQADFDSLPSVYTFLHTLLFGNNIKGEIPVAFVDSVEASVNQLLESAWKSFVECKRKTIPLIISFIGLVFHPVLFRVSSEQVRPYLRRAIKEFAESPRIATSVATHICGVCATDLTLAYSFLPELVDMCLVTEPAHMFGLPSLPEYKMWTQGHGLVITALIAGLPRDSTTNEFLGQLMLALLEQNFSNSEFATREHSQHSQTNKRKVRMWVTLTALVEYLEDSSAQLEKIAEKAWLSLQLKNHKNIRRLIQSFMLKFLHKHPRFLEIGLFPLLDDSNLQYQVGASVVIIAARILLESQSSSLPSYWMPLFRKLVPWSFHFHHAVRTCAQVALYTIMENNAENSVFQDASLQSMVQFLRSNKDCIRLRIRQRWFATKKHSSRKDEKAETYEKKEDKKSDKSDEKKEEEEAFEVDDEEDEDVSIPMDLLEHVKKAVKEFQTSMGATDSSAQKPEPEKDETTDFQKRILPWQMLDALPQLETREMKKQRQSIIVVASLIDNTPNIAGLVRTCEIFNVEAVVIGNKKIENEAQFQRVSVSAEKWVPILEVAPSNLPLYLKEKSLLGYTILGVEQTAHSETLATYSFPDKCVLVLGQEQHGIPADIIQLLDKCVEIPQLGMIRSLNVHVSASIVVWSYTQQHL